MLAFIVLSTEASACGGFFCNNVDPVDQSGETIVFGVKDGEVTTHVRIAYTGPGEDFAWVLPVPGVPDVFLSTNDLFSALDLPTRVTPNLQRSYSATCPQSEGDTDTDTDVDWDSSSDGGPTTTFVDVLAAAPVGPYETVVLQASDAGALVDWLQDNGYGVPDSMTPSIAPYLSNGMNFLALKLQKDATAGELAPLGIRWAGDRASIPLTLTAVAATPNMPLTVYVLGAHRAVPLSYLHVQLNPLAYNWFGAGPDLATRLGQASDEAGGLAFATAFAGPLFTGGLFWPETTTAGLAAITDPLAWFRELPSHGFFGTPEVLDILRIHLPAPPGVDEAAFYNAAVGTYYSSYYPSYGAPYEAHWAALAETFDPVAATEALEVRIVAPRAEAVSLLVDGPYVTRLETVISPEEMVVDPIFGFNPDLPDVASRIDGILSFRCGELGTLEDAERILSLPTGHTFELPSDTAMQSAGTTPSGWLDDQVGHVAIVVEQLSESGPGVILTDYRGELERGAEPADPLDGLGGGDGDEEPAASGGCGCTTGSAAQAIGLGGLFGLWTVRRRRHPIVSRS